jgi:glyoxylase-like metal-dependent hydrolase (beta-lactamase superfamily II)
MVGPPPASWAVTVSDAGARPVVEGVWRLRLPLPWDDIPHVNAYALAREDGGITLVDAGSAGDQSCWDAMVAALADAGFEVADVRAIVLTHYHSDHAGLVARFVDESGCEVLGHPDHAHFTDAMLRPGDIAAARERRARQEGVPEHRMHAYRTVREEIEGVLAPVFPDRHLRDGDRVDSSLGRWQVLETPGHAPSHICLYEPRASILLAGDLLAPTFHPYLDYGYSNDPVAELQASLRRVAALGPVRHVLPGHGRPLPDSAATIATWVAGLAEDVEVVLRAVAEEPAGGYALMERIYGPDDGTADGTWQLTRVLCHLRHLRLAGRVRRELDGDGRFRYAEAVPSSTSPR